MLDLIYFMGQKTEIQILKYASWVVLLKTFFLKTTYCITEGSRLFFNVLWSIRWVCVPLQSYLDSWSSLSGHWLQSFTDLMKLAVLLGWICCRGRDGHLKQKCGCVRCSFQTGRSCTCRLDGVPDEMLKTAFQLPPSTAGCGPCAGVVRGTMYDTKGVPARFRWDLSSFVIFANLILCFSILLIYLGPLAAVSLVLYNVASLCAKLGKYNILLSDPLGSVLGPV